MKNVTITLDEETAAWARAQAASQGMNLSRMIGELLEARMREHSEYEQAMQRFLARKPVRLGRGGRRYPKREELHERPRLR